MAKLPISRLLFHIEEEVVRNKETNTLSLAVNIKPRWFAKPFLYLGGFVALICEKYLGK